MTNLYEILEATLNNAEKNDVKNWDGSPHFFVEYADGAMDLKLGKEQAKLISKTYLAFHGIIEGQDEDEDNYYEVGVYSGSRWDIEVKRFLSGIELTKENI